MEGKGPSLDEDADCDIVGDEIIADQYGEKSCISW